MTAVSRREFVTVLAAAGGGLLLGYRAEGAQRAASTATAAATPGTTSASFAPNAFIRIPPDGSVTLVMPQAEMGQGVYTSLSMLLAEELEVAPDQIRLEHAPPDDKLYANQFFGEQLTGASSSVRAFYEPLRRAGATARAMLVAAAAALWNVDPASCRARKGLVTHTPTRRTLTYGVLASKAAALPVPDKVTLKDPKDFTLIGTPLKRLDTPSKVNGTAQYGIDVRLPGMLIATVAASPVLGGKVAGIDEQKAKAVPGVRQIVRLDDAVAVVADHMWAAKQGLAALDIRWDDGPNAKLSTPDIVRGLATASETAGVTARKDGDPESAFAGAAKKVEAVYESPFLAHVTMEPMNCTVHVRKDSCEVWTGSQVLSRARTTAAEVTGLPLEKVVVHNHLLGGGFGRRLEHDYVTQAVRIAKQVDAPVKVVWTREEDVQHDVYRPYYYDRMTAGLDPRGKPVAWTHRIVGPRDHCALSARGVQGRQGHRRHRRRRPAPLRHPGAPDRARAPRGARCSTPASGAAWESPITTSSSRASSTSSPPRRRKIQWRSGAHCWASHRAPWPCWTSRRRKADGARPCPVAAGVALPFSTATGAPTWRRSPKSK